MQDCSNSIGNALELLQSCANPKFCKHFYMYFTFCFLQVLGKVALTKKHVTTQDEDNNNFITSTPYSAKQMRVAPPRKVPEPPVNEEPIKQCNGKRPPPRRRKGKGELLDYHYEAESKWRPFHRRHFQMQFELRSKFH